MTLANSSNTLLPLSDRAFHKITKLVYANFGIVLSEKKRALVRGRLNKMVTLKGFQNYDDYLMMLEREGSVRDLLSLIDHISTNHSFFFRESEHLTYLVKTILPAMHSEYGDEVFRDFRIWSAGSASGQEAYTLAMILAEYFREHNIRYVPGILATDISVSSLQKAVTGIYPQQIISDIPPHYRKYFTQADTNHIQVSSALQQMVTFRRLNLKQNSFPFKGKFHIIFCRNVMIYFDHQTKEELVARFSKYTHHGGYLFIGHSESLGRISANYSYIRPTVYKRCVNL